MKRTTLTALTLTLVMLLLVALAAFIFLYQGRLGLQGEMATLTAEQTRLQQEMLQTGSNLAAAEATRDSVQTALATAESEQVVLEGELVTNQQQVDDLSQQLDELTDELDDANAALSRLESANLSLQSQSPLVQIASPEDGATFAPGEVVPIVLAASDVQTLTAVNLTINDETIASYDVDAEPLFATQTEWTAEAAGDYVLGVMAIGVNGRASTPVTITIHITLGPSEATAALRASIETNVVEIRGLTPLQPITPTLLTSAELRQRTEADFEEETTPEESRQDAIVLSAFDFMDKDYDLHQALIDLQSEAVAGFYDPETAEFVVVSDDDELNPNEQWTHAHEFMHALQDQYYPLELISDDTIDSEAKFALRSVAEGEATLIQLLYLRSGYFTEDEVNEIFAEINTQEAGILDELPPIIVSSFTFPYDAGFNFVLDMYSGGDLSAEGDFANLEAIWDDLPQSTEQIIHPDRYRAGDDPIPVSLPPLTDTLGIGWQQLDDDVFGEFTLREYLKQQLTEEEGEQAATGWGGDRYTVYWNEAEAQLVMALRLAWDSNSDGAEFASLYPAYTAALFNGPSTIQGDGECWQGSDAICLFHAGAESLIVRAPDVETAVRLQAQIQP
jgi:hypothetical protein